MAEHLEEETFTGKFDFSLWRRLVHFAVPYKRSIIGLMTFGMMVSAFDVALPLYNKAIINHLQAGGDLRGLMLILGAFVLTMVGFALTIWAFIVMAGKISCGVSHDIRRSCFTKLQDLSFSYFDRRAVGWLMSRLTGDCNNLSRVASWAMLDIAWGTFSVTLAGAVMLWHDVVLGSLIMVLLVPLWLVTRFFQVRMLKENRALRKAGSITTGAYNEGITGQRTTKSLVREEQNLAEFRELSGNMYRHALASTLYNAAFIPIVLSICTLGVGIALWKGGVDVTGGRLDLGTLVLFTQLSLFLMHPVRELANTFTQIQSAQTSAERILSVLDEPLEIVDAVGSVESKVGRDRNRDLRTVTSDHQSASSSTLRTPHSPLAPDGHPHRIERIDFRNVQFQYKTGPVVLHDFNFTVRAGQSVALVGATGGGKSTIVSLLCRFYEPTSGGVFIDDVEYRNRSLRWLQSQLGMVPQQPHLFSGTVRENIRYGRLDATNAEIEAAATLTRAHEFIATLKDGYDAKVGEGGNQLSTGQKQLIALARAIIADPQIFILDEATSSVDTHTERAIQQAVDTAMKGRISFVIAHRLSTIKRCDTIVVIDAGRIVEQGSHHDLLAMKGRYYELYTNQFTAEHEEHLLHA
jgi:ATP-binding cassette, subfamily B, bacterial